MTIPTFRVFRRMVYFRKNGEWIPTTCPPEECRTIAKGVSESEARRICRDGPANTAIREGREYYHLPFYEYEEE